jgi:hypothetical protein
LTAPSLPPGPTSLQDESFDEIALADDAEAERAPCHGCASGDGGVVVDADDR